MSTDEMEKYKTEDRVEEAGQCVMGEMRKDREESDWKVKYAEERKLRQEAENEMVLIKGITVTNSPELREANKKIIELETRLAEVLGIEGDHQKLNGKLQMRVTELEQDNLELHADNKKLAQQVEDKIDRLRKSGM
jgi:hypothetical protein